jgi:SAM-dependent methyltransferase
MNPSDTLKRQVSDYYSEKILAHGTTARGVDWNSTESQWLRFEQLLLGFDLSDAECRLNDFGCGYGELLRCLETYQFAGFYRGYDLSPAMIKAASDNYTDANLDSSFKFILGDDLEQADYTLASGIFNVRQTVTDTEWEDYIKNCLNKMRDASQKGFSFNMLTLYSDPPLRKDYLYYADPLIWFDYCKRHFSKNVALLHDYNLYEFTMRIVLEN